MIPIDDRGFTLGDGLFETVLADAGRLVAFDRHMARMLEGAALLGLPAPSASEAEVAARAALETASLTGTRAAVRRTWTAGSGGRGLERPDVTRPRLLVSCAPAPFPTTPARLMLSSVRRNEGSPSSRCKSMAYLDNLLARREARLAGADEALMLNNAGDLACAAAANVFWIRGGRLFTPSLACGVLAGIVRAQTMNCAGALGIEVTEIVARPEVLEQAEAVFLTNSLIGVRPTTQARTAEGRALLGALTAAVEAVRNS